MSLNATPRGDRIHIALFGKRNAGKSSVINAMTNQELAIVSNVKGTTTDPVYKAMELLPLGPVVMIDTPGLDDEGELGEKRVKKAKEVLAKADIALVIMDATAGMTEFEEDMIRLIEDRKIPYLKVYNKMDLANAQEWKEDKACFVSAKDKKGIWELKEEIGKLVPTDDDTLKIVGDLVCPNDFVILVVPIDSAAPKGRLILPQQQTIRDLLEAGAASIVVRETELEKTLEEIGKKPALVITDSQAFGEVSKIVPEDVKLTSFSILFARYKGDLEEEVRGVKALEHLEEGAKILIAEGCTHHRQCDDIGTVKIPRWLKQYNRIYRERLINRIRERMGKKKTIICQKEKKLYQRLLLGGKFILQRCVFELYYPVNNDRYEMILELLEKNRTNMMEEQFFIFGSYVESIYGNSEINRYQQWLENNGSEKNKALILYLRAVWEVAKDEYDLFNETALKYARESLECDKDIPAVYHIIGRLTSPDTSEYEKIKKDLKKHVVYISLQEIEEMPLNKLYSYDTFLKMDILKKIIKPKNFSLILLEEVSDNFWNWEL